MKRFKGLLAVLIAFFGLFALASCGKGAIISSKDVDIEATATKDRIDLDITLSENQYVKNKTATFYVVCKTVTDEEIKYHSKKDIKFENSVYTHASLSFTSLASNQEYEFVLYLTYNVKDSILKTIRSKTTDYVDSEIKTAAQFKQNLVQDKSGDYKIVSDINFSGESLGLFATESNAFKGTIDGGIYENDVLVGCHKITNYNLTSAKYIGLFGYLSNATIKNLIIEDVEGTFTSRSDTYIGSLVGYAVNTIIENVTIDGVEISVGASSTAIHYTGGVVGYAEKCTINNVYADNVNVTYTAARKDIYVGLFAGTIVGDGLVDGEFINHAGVKGELKITATYPTSSQDAKGCIYAGGFIGLISSGGLVNDCYTIVDTTFTASEFDGRKYNIYYGSFAGANSNNMYIKNSVAKTNSLSAYARAFVPENDDERDDAASKYLATEKTYLAGFMASVSGIFRGIDNCYAIVGEKDIVAKTTAETTVDDVTTTVTVLFVEDLITDNKATDATKINNLDVIENTEVASITGLSEKLIAAITA